MTCKTCAVYQMMGLSQHCPCTHINGRCTTMHTFRRQSDDDQQRHSDAAAIDFTDDPGKTRQEFKDEADTNILLKRFGVGIPQKQVTYGETDFNIDLQTALEAVAIAKKAYKDLPADLRKQYPSWQTLLNHIESGKLTLDLTPPKKDEPKTDVPPEPKKV